MPAVQICRLHISFWLLPCRLLLCNHLVLAGNSLQASIGHRVQRQDSPQMQFVLISAFVWRFWHETQSLCKARDPGMHDSLGGDVACRNLGEGVTPKECRGDNASVSVAPPELFCHWYHSH